MRLLLFGHHLAGDGYPRLAVLAAGLRSHGIEVIEVRRPFLAGGDARARAASSRTGLVGVALRAVGGAVRLALAYLRAPAHDAVLVGYPGHVAVHVARLGNLLRRRPVLLDGFLSLHDTVVTDRGLAAPGSLRARALRVADWAAFRAADLVLVDTAADGEFFHREFGVPRGRLRTVLVGAESRGERAAEAERPVAAGGAASRPLEVLWFGTYVPLQGVATILDAAALLREDEIRLTLVGRGQELAVAQRRAADLGLGPPRVRWEVDFLPRAVLEERIRGSDVCLGIFGAGPKALRVVPCKVYDALAAGCPVITSDTPAAREVLTDGEDAILVPPGDAAALAAALRRVARDPALRGRLARGAARLYGAHLSPPAVTAALAEELCGTPPRTA